MARVVVLLGLLLGLPLVQLLGVAAVEAKAPGTCKGGVLCAEAAAATAATAAMDSEALLAAQYDSVRQLTQLVQEQQQLLQYQGYKLQSVEEKLARLLVQVDGLDLHSLRQALHVSTQPMHHVCDQSRAAANPSCGAYCGSCCCGGR